MAADGLKQRLVGGAALFVIGVIAWFWLLSADSPVDPVARTTQIPTAPEFKPVAVAEPQAPQDVTPVPSARATEPVASAPAEPTPQPKPLPDAAKPPVSAANTTAKMPPTTAPSQPAKIVEPKSVAVVKTPTETFQLDQQGLPVAWVVQIGLFSTQTNADRIKGALQQKGFKAYTQTIKAANGGTAVKVFVGPKLSRERADAQKKAIDEAMKMNTMVVRFAP